jgi:hypothetical protein
MSAVPSVTNMSTSTEEDKATGLAIGTKEEELGLSVEINNALLDTRCFSRNEEVNNGLNTASITDRDSGK